MSLFSFIPHLRRVFNQPSLVLVRNATKKAGGSTKNGRDSPGKHLGVKKFGGEHVIPGNIIIRQRGKSVHPGENVGLGRDYTLFALVEGFVHFRFNSKIQRNIVSVLDRKSVV
jgi:large subunit ribosomal protein L27